MGKHEPTFEVFREQVIANLPQLTADEEQQVKDAYTTPRRTAEKTAALIQNKREVGQ